MTRKFTVSKGYRLKPSTHKLIKKVQQLLSISQDAVISQSVTLFRKGLGITVKKHNQNNQ